MYLSTVALTLRRWLVDIAASSRPPIRRRLAPGTSTAAPASSDPPAIASLDIVSIYHSHARSMSMSKLELAGGVPSDVAERLAEFRLKFDELSGLLQRALLWDMGYVRIADPDGNGRVAIAPVFVVCGLQMSEIVPNRQYVESIGCTTLDCSVLNATSGAIVAHSYRANGCEPTADIARLSRCAVGLPTADNASIPMARTETPWAIGSLNPARLTSLPLFWLQQRRPGGGSTATVGIYTASDDAAGAGQCPSMPTLITPCATVERVSMGTEWCRPVGSALMGTWLQQEQRQEMALATLILFAGAILFALALDLFVDRKPRFFARNSQVAALPSLTSTMFDVTVHTAGPSQSSAFSIRSSLRHNDGDDDDDANNHNGNDSRAPSPTAARSPRRWRR